MLSKEENYLIKIIFIYFFSNALASLFLNVFLFRLGGFSTIVLFNLVQLIFLLITYISSGWSLKKYSTKILIRISLLTFSIGWISLLLLKQNAIEFIIPLGIIFGFAHGHFWSGFNLSQYILTHQDRRELYFSKNNFVSSIASASGPIIGGFIVLNLNVLTNSQFTGYYILFLVVFLLNLGNFFLARYLPEHKGIDFSLSHIMNHKREFSWKIVLFQQFIVGLYDVAFSVLSGIAFFVIIRHEGTLGTVGTITGLITALSSMTAGKLLIKYKKLYWIGALGTFFGILLFSYFKNWTGIFFLIFFIGFSSPFLNIALSSAILNGIDKNKESWKKKYHMLIERDTVLGVARIVSHIILFLLFTQWDKAAVAFNWMMSISILPLVLGVLLLMNAKKSAKFGADSGI